jgi:hypothetical protein
MTNTYTWSIESLECIPSSNGQSNVVSVIHWRCKGSDGTNSTENYGAIPLPYVQGTFVNYSDLTEAIVIGWLQAELGQEEVAEIEASLDNKLAILANPPIVSLQLPWSNA